MREGPTTTRARGFAAVSARTKFAVCVVSSVFVVLGSGVHAASATAIREPTAKPFSVAVAGFGVSQPFTVVATGFRPGSLVYIEQCDGTPVKQRGWSPTLNCDLGSAPAPVVAARDGTARFDAGDRNHAFRAFRGESPQTLFNCVVAGEAPPRNGLPAFSNCRVRVSSNNASVTDDQTFFDVRLVNAPRAAATAPTTGTTTAGGAPTATSSNDTTSTDPSSSAASATPSAGSAMGSLAFTGAQLDVLVRGAMLLLGIGVLMSSARPMRRAD
jgi:hypothetical protein